MKYRLITFITVLFISLNLWAIPAQHGSFVHTQKDGTKITVMLVGDEYLNYYLNVETGEKLVMGDDGDLRALAETDFIKRRDNALLRRKAVDMNRMERLKALPKLTAATNIRSAAAGMKKVGSVEQMLGEKKGLVILVNFSDKTFLSSHDNQTFNDMYNLEGYSQNGHIGSLHDYFLDQSYGKLNLAFDVIGPVTMSKKMSYYGSNDSYGNDAHAYEMVIEACQQIDDEVNFADYDWDGDGVVEQVFVVYAGYGENYAGSPSNTIWPHEWDLESASGSTLQLDDVTINVYACAAELCGSSGTAMNGIGCSAHEFSHCLGYPDFYDTTYSGGIGMSKFDVLCSGSYSGPQNRGEVPCGFTAYERWMAGWLEPIELEHPDDIKDMPALNDEPVAYIIYNKDNRNEYMMLENRQSDRWFKWFGEDEAGHGLFIVHTDYDYKSWTENTVNSIPAHQRMSWVAADRSYGTSFGTQWRISEKDAKGDFFPGLNEVTMMTKLSHASVGGKWYSKENNSKNFSHELTEITESEDGLISFKYDGGYPTEGNLWTVTFDAGTGNCEMETWKQEGFYDEVMMPEATTDFDDWFFYGWSSKTIDDTTEAPEVIFAGEKFFPQCDTTFHAVYFYVEPGDLELNRYFSNNPRNNNHAPLVGIEIATPPTKTVYFEGEPFENDGMVVVAKYEDGEEREVVNYTCTPEILELGTTEVTVAYTEKGITQEAKVAVTVNELPRYTVTFVINQDEEITVKEETYQSGVVVPEVETAEGYSLAGWSLQQVAGEVTEQPDFVSVVNGLYMPTADVTLYAVYAHKVVDPLAEPIVFGLSSDIPGMPTSYNAAGVSVLINDVSFDFTDVASYTSGCFQFKKVSGHIAATLPEKVVAVDIEYNEESMSELVDESDGYELLIKNVSEYASKVNNINITCEAPKITVFGSVVNDVNDGIKTVETKESNVQKGCYNLAGQRVNADTKGIIIVDGRKVVNK